MSNLLVSEGIGFGTLTGAAFYTDDSRLFSTPKDTQNTYNSLLWVPWGDNNDEPALIADDIENCPVLGAAVEAEARLAVGKGPEPYLLVDKDKDGNETLEWVDDPEIADWLELNQHFEYSYRNIYNMIAYGWSTTQFILNKGRNRINRVRATDVYTGRLEKKDNFGNIGNLYTCADWSMATSYDPNTIKRIPLWDEGYELQQLEESINGFEFAMLHRLLRNGTQYYPKPLHRAAKAWVKITRSIPNIKNAMNVNMVNVKYVIIIAENYWKRMHPDWDSYEADKRQTIVEKKYAEINSWLTGELNAGKSIIAGRYFDNNSETFVDDITITVVDDKMKDGKMLPDSAAADKQILFSMFFNPAIWGGNLLGDGASGGAGSGSDIREATLVLLSLLHPERQKNLSALNIVKNYNGWAKRLEVQRDVFAVSNTPANPAVPMAKPATTEKKITPRLVWRYNNTLLTTLDTGKQQKQTNN